MVAYDWMNDAYAYWLDSSQRWILFMDILRKRGNNYFETIKKGEPPVLVFDYEVILEGRTFDRPVNYDLARIKPRKTDSLDPEKRPILMEAVGAVARRFSEAVFLFVGDGPEHAKLKKKARKLGLGQRVVLAGPRSDVPNVLSMLDVFVLPSLKEGLPMAVLEAGAARVPTIATRVGAIPRVVEDGVSGILVPPKQPEAIAQAIIRILSDREEAQEMAKEANQSKLDTEKQHS